ncbi:MAG: CotH kinase family protein [Planctomycetota bacterium]
MNQKSLSPIRLSLCVVLAASASLTFAQPPQRGGGFGGGPGFGPPGFGPGGSQEEKKLVEEFDQDKNGWLNREERAQAREAAKQGIGGGRGFGPPGGSRGLGNRQPAQRGRNVTVDEVKQFPNASLYEPAALRTLFFEFENEDWEKELEDFHGTDVDVAAKMTVDGKTYENVGMRFRGMSSYGMVSTGFKRSFNVSMDLADKDQRLYGHKTLNLLNSSGDPSFMSTVLYSHIASQYIPVPKANHVHVVINGESWGIYVNVQQYNKDFLAEHFESTKGTRWKVSGNPGADGGLRYLGEDLEEYKQRFDMKSKDGKKAWAKLVLLCKTLNETPLDQLESALEPMLDIDETLRFLALDVALVNSDGYWTRASDYSLFLDSDKRFHVIPHDMNEAFQSGRGGPGRGGPGGPPRGPGGFGGLFGAFGFGGPPERDDRPEGSGAEPRRDDRRSGSRERDRFSREGRDRAQGPDSRGQRRDRGGFGGPPRGHGGGGPGRGGGPGHGGVDLDPLVSIDNPRMPLRSRLLAVPKLRAKYLQYVHEIAEKSLDWNAVEPVVAEHTTRIAPEVKIDAKKLDTFEAFQQSTSVDAPDSEDGRGSLRAFFDGRREYLLNYKEPTSKDAATR